MRNPFAKMSLRAGMLPALWLSALMFLGAACIVADAGISEGMTREEVIEAWGYPRAQLRRDNREHLYFDGEREVELLDGIVQHVEGALVFVHEPMTSAPPVEESFSDRQTESGATEPPDTALGLSMHAFNPEMLLRGMQTFAWIVTAAALILSLLMFVSMWKISTKAGEPGWSMLAPIYNIIVMLRIADKPAWWVLLYFTPLAPIVVLLVDISTAKNFGKSAAFGLGIYLMPLIFYPILAFGKAQHCAA